MIDRQEPKPTHLGPQYASQFRDNSVAGAYAARPPYPDEVFDILEALMPGQPCRLPKYQLSGSGRSVSSSILTLTIPAPNWPS